MQTNSLILLVLLFCITSTNSYSQGRNSDQLVVKGRITDASTDSPLEFATVALYSLPDSNIIGGGLSETDGTFEILS